MGQLKSQYEIIINEADISKIDQNIMINLYEKQIQELKTIESEITDKRLIKFINEAKKICILRKNENMGIICVDKPHYNFLRTFRNKNLISESEQEKLNAISIAVIGLSVGGEIVNNLTRSGIGSQFILFDDDLFDTTNSNRVDIHLDDLYKSKVDVVTNRIIQANPFSKIYGFKEKFNEKSHEKITSLNPSIIFDECDDFIAKIECRKFAKSNQIPLVMITNVDRTTIVDIERYDLEDTEFFNGQISIEEIEDAVAEKRSTNELAVKIVDKSIISKRALDSVQNIGKKLGGRPQLFSTVSIGSGLASNIVNDIFNGHVPSGRYHLKSGEIINE